MAGTKSRQYTHIVITAAIFLAIVPILNGFGIISDLNLTLTGRFLCFAIAAIGLDLIWGFTGILSLTHAFFFCLGGYAIGMHMLLQTGTQGVYGSKLPDFMVWNRVEKLPVFWEPFDHFYLAIPMAFIVTGLAAFIFGYLAFRSRIKGVYFSILSQALALAMWLIFLRNETMLGGTNGLTDFKTLLGMDLTSDSSATILYFASAIALVTCLWLGQLLVKSKSGRILIGIRDSENRISFTGFAVHHFKVFVFVVGALFACIGGMLYVPQTGIITPGRMDVQASIEMVIWVALGGRGTLYGPVMGALGVNFCYSILTGTFPQSWPFFLAALFISVVLFFPRGLAGGVETLAGKLQRKGRQHEKDSTGSGKLIGFIRRLQSS